MKTSRAEQENVHQIVDQLQAANIVRLDYGGLTDDAIIQLYNGEPVYDWARHSNSFFAVKVGESPASYLRRNQSDGPIPGWAYY